MVVGILVKMQIHLNLGLLNVFKVLGFAGNEILYFV